MSDGEGAFSKDSKKITEAIARENHRLGNSVTIMTFGIGDRKSSFIRHVPGNIYADKNVYLCSTAIDSEWSDLLKAMAQQTTTNSSYGPVKKGEYFHIKNAIHLRTKLAKYYNMFSNPSDFAKPVVSAPYYDSLASGCKHSFKFRAN